jgi:hypothetical protein
MGKERREEDLEFLVQKNIDRLATLAVYADEDLQSYAQEFAKRLVARLIVSMGLVRKEVFDDIEMEVYRLREEESD